MSPPLTREQKRAFVAELTPPFGALHLICDGDLVSLTVYRHTPMAYRVATYVNGSIKGAWWDGDKSFPEQKYLRRIEKPRFKPSDLEFYRRLHGARKVAADPKYHEVLVYFSHDWASGGAVLAHLARVCQSIRAATEEEREAMLQASAVRIDAAADSLTPPSAKEAA